METPLSRRERQFAKTRYFIEPSLFRADSGETGRSKHGPGFDRVGDYPRFQRAISPVLDVPAQILDQG